MLVLTMLDKETFSYWVTHPDDLTPADLTQLQESLLDYPYCQSLHTLTAKAASMHNKGQTVPLIRQAAAHALSRNALRKLIDNEFKWSENLLGKLNELTARHVPIPDDYQQESYVLFKAKAGVSENFLKLPLLHIPGQVLPAAETIPAPEDPTLLEANLQTALVQIDETKTTPLSADAEQKRQFELIESFIQKEPRISRTPVKSGEVLDQEDLSKRAKPPVSGLVTESFAKILTKQGKHAKARAIYETLMAKNPEKSAYFAAKISELDQQNPTH